MTATFIAGARIVDPASRTDAVGGVLIENGVIVDIGAKAKAPAGAAVIDGAGKTLIPGLVDMRVVIGEPGAEHKETLKSAGRAAAAGGVTTMVVMPNTDPVIDDVSLVDFIKRRGEARAGVRVLPSAALTKHLDGELMTEIGLLAEAGAVLFSNGDRPIVDSRVLRRALAYSSAFGALIAHRPEDPFLATGGVAHESALAGRMGLAGVPAAAERIYAERDCALAEITGGRLLLDMLSSAQALGPLRRAKEAGVRVHASVSIHHLTLNELELNDYRTFAKFSPPLRSEDDRQALIAGLRDGLIDVIVSGHDPRPPEEKRLPFDEAAFGASALETLLPAALGLYHAGDVPLMDVIAAMTSRPADLLGLDQGRLAKGAPADMVLIDLDAPFKFDAEKMLSKCRNTPFDGRLMQGRVVRTLVGGETVFGG
ncbi:MAG: dihydroorotase [Alphaproteobacteria bacterium]|nr:MAG: dihydroorotase [Caulobacteraceae bacterium]TPW02593.1 MAG: dihydroorotase [Alphaproteobacteria bacterium]